MRRLYKMIYTLKNADDFSQFVTDYRKDHHVKLTRNELRNWFFTLNNINALKNGVTTFQGEALEEFGMPKKLAGFVTPSKVTVSQSNFEKDFLSKEYKRAELDLIEVKSKRVMLPSMDAEMTVEKRDEVQAEIDEIMEKYDIELDDNGDQYYVIDQVVYQASLLDAEQFTKVSRKINRCFKFSDTDIATVDEKRVEVLLSTVQDQAIVDGCVRKVQTPFAPLMLDFTRYEEDEYTYKVDKMFRLFYDNKLLNSSSNGEKDK